MQETQALSLGQEDPLEEEMATYSGILARIILWTEEPEGYSPPGCKTVRHHWARMHVDKDCATCPSPAGKGLGHSGKQAKKDFI